MYRRKYKSGIIRKIKEEKANTPRIILIFLHSYSPELLRDIKKLREHNGIAGAGN
jgi:hypothetical protein